MLIVVLFAQAYTIPREQRTVEPTVPREALSRSTSLFTREVSGT